MQTPYATISPCSELASHEMRLKRHLCPVTTSSVSSMPRWCSSLYEKLHLLSWQQMRRHRPLCGKTHDIDRSAWLRWLLLPISLPADVELTSGLKQSALSPLEASLSRNVVWSSELEFSRCGGYLKQQKLDASCVFWIGSLSGDSHEPQSSRGMKQWSLLVPRSFRSRLTHEVESLSYRSVIGVTATALLASTASTSPTAARSCCPVSFGLVCCCFGTIAIALSSFARCFCCKYSIQQDWIAMRSSACDNLSLYS